MKKIIGNLSTILGVLLLVWIFASVINIGFNNSPLASENNYAWWNVFNIVDYFEGS